MLKALMLVAYLMSHPVGDDSGPAAFLITSPAFVNASTIPITYTCRGKDISIPVAWSGIPQGTKSLALIMIDQDVPRRAWYHWAVYNIPITIAGFKPGAQLSSSIDAAENSWGNAHYQGPCPPSGEHHYVISLFALDTVLPAAKRLSTIELRESMRQHVIAATEIMGHVTAVTPVDPHP